MAKKAPVKKTKRRLKRSVRRSLAAVLMVTSIAVAAIPVPENVAAPDGDNPAVADAYEEQIELGERDEIASDSNRVYSLVVYNEGLYWQYKIDISKTKIVQYNANFPSISLSVSQSVPTNFDYVLKSEYDSFCTTKYVLSEENYFESTSLTARQFFERYFKDDSEYVAFKQKMEDGEASSIERSVTSLNDVNRRTYYCILHNMPDYVLEPVKVQIGADAANPDDSNVLTQINETGKTISSGDDIYIPKYAAGPVNEAPKGEVDEDGYRLFSGTTSHSNTQRITQIGNYAFAGNGILKIIDLPDWLQAIGEGAFMGCSYLDSVNIPFLQNVPDGAFKNCSSLRTVNWWSEGNTSGLSTIGIEAFYGTGVQENVSGQGTLKFPIGIEIIDDAAFYGCKSLRQIEFDSGGNQVAINQYAFYNNTALNAISFQEKGVKSFGDYCFAMGDNTNVLSDFTFPNSSFTTGKQILGRRTALRTITVPENVGRLGGDILEGCTGLQSATFRGVYTSYAPELFASVTQEEFYVTGPATTDPNATRDDVTKASDPRKSTWDAQKTAANQYVPYLYTIGGKEYYEICSGDGFLESIDKATGTLTSCNVKDVAIGRGSELVIPDQVGGTPVIKIGSGCFSDPQFKQKVGKLTIGNNIAEIESAVFKEWVGLNEVNIGKGIKVIGSEAFAGCTSLTDVIFQTPNDYSLTIEDKAFDTNSGRLTIHGDFVENLEGGYAPFNYAMNPANYVTNSLPNGSVEKRRILYQSRWDSPSSKHMSVIYGEQDDGNGYVTLVDYPLYQDFFSVDADGNITADLSADLQGHNQDMEQGFYEYYGGNYTEPSEEDAALEKKLRFAKAYDDDPDAAYDSEYYGPWINPSFCANYTRWLDQEWQDTLTSSTNTDWNWLFKPLVVQAADGPSPYFKKHPYNFVKNYLDKNGDRSQITQDYLDGWTTDEEKMIEAVEKITIPQGVQSIDLVEYYNAEVPDDSAHQNVVRNRENYIAYFGNSSDNRRTGIFVYDVSPKDAGLFRSSGIDDHYSGTNIDYGEHKRGNDRIREVDMSKSSITSIPDYAFEDCELLEKVTIPATCQSVGLLPFKDCNKLSTLNSESEDVPAKNGIIYQRKPDNSYELVECVLTRGENGENSIVDSATDGPYIDQVSSIGESAFQNCNGISAVDLSGIDNGASSEKLKEIPDYCFENCNKLVKVILPLSTNDIGQRAFADIRKDSYFINNLPESGRLEVTIKGSEVNISETAFDPKGKSGESTINMVTIWTYENSAAERYVLEQQKLGYDIRLGNQAKDHNNPQYLGKTIRVNFWDWNGNALCDTIYLSDPNKNWIRQEDIPAEVVEKVNEEGHRPGYIFTDWLASGGQKIGEPITTDEITYVAQYSDDGTTVNGRYPVEFYDSFDYSSMPCMGAKNVNGTWICYVDAGKSLDDMTGEDPDNPMSAPYPEPSHDKLTFKRWQDTNGNTWNSTEEFNAAKINGRTVVVALYDTNTTSNGSTTTSNNTTNTSNNTSNTPNTSGNTTNNNNTSNRSTSTTSTSNTSSSTSSSSTSTSSTTSDGRSVAMYTVLVQNGSGSGSYAQGATVVISAYPPAEGMVFSKWTTESTGVVLASDSTPVTTFVMPGNNVTITANYVAGTAPATNTAGTTGTTPVNNGNTTVDITKPGISNKDLATANVNGSTDNFIVKISETDAATQAVSAALTNKYGNLENILYYAMDITLWDSTGTYQLTGDQVAGLSVDITIPIPDALVAYGGNNMAGAVVNGDQLENLNESFTTINGVPCIRFTATHFSPYTIYVDTGNLTEGMLDVTPKTGDPIHPKWFLSIGLACLSIALFMKKDKKVKTKTA